MDNLNFPRQMLPFNKKNKEWRKQCMLWASQRTFFNYSPVTNSILHKKINYDLLSGKLHMSDIERVLNPVGESIGKIDSIPHYPIMNSKLSVLIGEELKRPFEYRAIVTNPTAISEKENTKKTELFESLNKLIQDTSLSEEEYNSKVSQLSNYYKYEWQDFRELRANMLLNHYSKENNFPLIFNNGYRNGLISGEEIYQCNVISGEPTLEIVNPLKIRAFRTGYSNKIEDADVIILEDYWSPGRIIDTYYNYLSKKDIEYLENLPDYIGQGTTDSAGNIDERFGFLNTTMIDDTITESDGAFYFDPNNVFSDSATLSLMPYDLAGNVRVLRLYWKSKRRILKVKSYDPITGKETFKYYSDSYVIDKDLGEEVKSIWINEAWHGTMIGGIDNGIFVNIEPMPIQYNDINNPSKCHFGIVGTIYNLNDDRPYSLVDMMKPYNYLYDVIHDRLNRAIATNWGSILEMDFSKIPRGWDIAKWMYYARTNHIAVVDSFKEGTIGASTGKLSGALNNASKGIMDSNIGNYIQQQINLLEYIKAEMGEVAGISRQREGQISNRETVGGIERANLQSSHITEWYFAIHNDTRRRTLNAFLDTAKQAIRGRNLKFQYILPDSSIKMVEINGDEFSEASYGVVIDGEGDSAEFKAKLDSLAQAALQNNKLSFSAIMKLFSSSSLAEKQRMVENDEARIEESQRASQQQNLELQRELANQDMEMKRLKMEQEERADIRANETKLAIAGIKETEQ